ncbi:MAG: CoA transferase subunit A [Candidatus Dormibacteraeota bacterium]|nr:CoA transferase subunit A [Candidatus Dormibacteraeota bacterium]
MPARFLDPDSAVQAIRDGDVILCGGFGLVGMPLRLVDALARLGRRDLTVVSNNVGEAGLGLGALLRDGRLRKAVGSYFTSNPEVAEARREGRLEVELLPQGTLAEAIRAGGAGIAAFYTPTAAGTLLAEGKESRTFEDGREYVLERALRGDVALVKAHRADRLGNLVYRGTARNFNPLMATAASTVIAEVEEVVEVGALDPETIVTPHLYVDVVVPP